MSSLLPSRPSTDEETTSKERARGKPASESDSRGGSMRRRLGLAAAGLGAVAVLRRLRSGRRKKRSQSASSSSGTSDSQSSGGGLRKRLTGRTGRMVAGVLAATAVRRLLRRWRRR